MGNLTQATMADLTFLDSQFSIRAGIENRKLHRESRLTTDCQLTFERYCNCLNGWFTDGIMFDWLINWVAWLITDRLTVWMVDLLTGELLNLLTDWLTFWMVDRWTDGLTNFVDVIIFIAIFCYFSPNCHVQLSNRYM